MKKIDWLVAGKVLMIAWSFYGCGPGKNISISGTAIQPSDWYAYVKDQKFKNAREVFNLSDTLIRLYGDRPGYLMTKRSYKNFELVLDYKWNTEAKYSRGSGKRNSGVMYNVPDSVKDVLWPAGIQFQVKEGGTGDFILLENVTLTVRGETKPPGKSVAVARLDEQDKAAGEWNRITIISNNGTCKQYLNGVLVNEGTNASSVSGRILLQYEGSPIDFKNIVIKSL